MDIHHHPVRWVETMVDTTRFTGTVYRAANWILIGVRSGRGLRSKYSDPRRSVKNIFGYPLTPDFRARLRHDE
jgi:hypothetical protein